MLGEDRGVLTSVALMRCYEPQLAVFVLMVVPVDEAVDPAPGFLQAVAIGAAQQPVALSLAAAGLRERVVITNPGRL